MCRRDFICSIAIIKRKGESACTCPYKIDIKRRGKEERQQKKHNMGSSQSSSSSASSFPSMKEEGSSDIGGGDNNNNNNNNNDITVLRSTGDDDAMKEKKTQTKTIIRKRKKKNPSSSSSVEYQCRKQKRVWSKCVRDHYETKFLPGKSLDPVEDNDCDDYFDNFRDCYMKSMLEKTQKKPAEGSMLHEYMIEEGITTTTTDNDGVKR